MRSRASSNAKRGITRGDLKLLGCTMVFLLAVLLKYADFSGAEEIRIRAAALLHGGIDTQEVMTVLGRVAGENGVAEVFQGKETLQQVFRSIKASIPQNTLSQQSVQTEPAEPAGMEPATEINSSQEAPQYAESAYSEDLENREETIFPKIADETNYLMAFTHVKPVEATLTSNFGAREHPIKGEASFHYGLDLAAPEGTPIGAFADGTVRQTGSGSYGNYLIVDHKDGFSTLYAHCSKLIAKQGDKVIAGQEIAQVGATGQATGNHLHLEIWHDGKALNPSFYVSY